MLKRLLKSNGMIAFAGWIAAAYIWVVYRTSHWQVINGDLPHRYLKDNKPFIATFWHGRLLMMPVTIPKKAKVHVMISQHGDGEIIARAVRHWGQTSIRGSSSKGALPAIKEMLRLLKGGGVGGITPDGPRGPRMHAQDGIVRIAAMSGVPVIPVTYSVTRGERLKSWDRFLVAKPFSKGVIIWGDPIEVPRKDEEGAHAIVKQRIEDSLTKITQEADIFCGQVPVEPAEREASHNDDNGVA